MYIHRTYYHPTFLYESLWNIIGVLVLIVLRKSFLKRGEVFLTYLLWYSIGRFFIEGLRTDSLMLTSHIRIAQLVSFLCVLGSLILLWYRRKKGLAISKAASLS